MRGKHLIILVICLSLQGIAWALPSVTSQVFGIKTKTVQSNINKSLKELQDSTQADSQFARNRFLWRARHSIRKAMQPYGYFKAKVKSNFKRQGKTWLATFNVTPGPQIRINRLDIRLTGPGTHCPAFQKMLRKLPLKVGDALNTPKYLKAKQAFFDTAQQFGFFKAKMSQSKIVVNAISYHATIIIHFNTGPRFRFGKTTFSKAPLALSFLKRYLRYHQGQYFNDKILQRTQQDLAQSPYFQQAFITPLTDEAKNGEVPIRISLASRKARQYIFGIGYGFDSNVRGTIGMTFNRVNRYGHRFDVLGQASINNSRFVSHYYIPGPRPARDLFTASAGIGHIEQVNGNSNVNKVSVEYSMKFEQWEQNIALTYLNETYHFNDLFGKPFSNNAQYIFPSIQWHNVHTRTEIHPKHGYNLSVSLAGAPKETVFASESFFQVRADGKLLTTFTPTHTRFIARGSIGRTVINNIQDLPLSMQLFTGGATTVRGFSYNAIGPGFNLIVGSAEIQQRIYKQWYLAGFYDVGNVSNNNPFKQMKRGAGGGIVWLSPIGTVEVDLAFAVSSSNSPWRIQFSIGPDL